MCELSFYLKTSEKFPTKKEPHSSALSIIKKFSHIRSFKREERYFFIYAVRIARQFTVFPDNSVARDYNCNRIFPHSSANRLCGHSGNIFDFRDFSCNFSVGRRFSVRNLKKQFPNELLKLRSRRIYSRNVPRIFSRKIYIQE